MEEKESLLEDYYNNHFRTEEMIDFKWLSKTMKKSLSKTLGFVKFRLIHDFRKMYKNAVKIIVG